jgi:para-nitrobenzyl esterase
MKAIKTESGYVSGLVLGQIGQEVYVYRGIPYAASSAGDNRWKPPKPVVPWTGTRECTEYGDAAPQEPPGPPFPFERRSEDCLNVNVLTPVENSTGKLPVMVWLHGGGYDIGSANNQLYSSVPLAQHGVVLVAVNHRLNLFGLMAHPLLSRESPQGVSGNYLFLDIIAALKWVQKNIAAFGGDPGNVTIFGESGGGAKVSNLMASTLARGLFHRAICESGTSIGSLMFAGEPLEKMEANGQKLFARLGVEKEKDPLEVARSVPWREVLKAQEAVAAEIGKGEKFRVFLWDAGVDGWFLKESPIKVFQKGNHNAVPLITGANVGEMDSGMVVMPWVIPAYARMLGDNNKTPNKGYAYMFDRVPPGWQKTGMKSNHGLELN